MSKTYYTGFFPDPDAPGAKGSAAFRQYTAQLSIYKRSPGIPDTPTTGSYNFRTSQLTPPSGWSETVPDGADPLWVSYARLESYDVNEVVTPITWSVPIELTRTPDAVITVRVTNPTVIVPADSNGDNQVVTNSGTQIYVYEGQTLLEYDGLGASDGTWRIFNRISTNVTLGTIAGDSASYATINDIVAMTADSGSVRYVIEGFTLAGNPFSIEGLQDFNRLNGLVLDTAPPGAPTGLALTSSVATLDGGNTTATIVATWNANTESDLNYYEVEIKQGTGTYIAYQTSTNRYSWNVETNKSYTVRVRALDKNDNRSAYSTEVSHTTVKDTTLPAAPSTVVATAAFKNVYLAWTNPADNDLAYIEVWRNTTNNTSTASRIATVAASNSTPGAFTDSSGIINGTTYYYWLKSVDTSNNVSAAFTPTNSSALSSVTITGTSGQFSCASTSLRLGQVIIISGSFGGTGSIVGYSSPTTYVISATNGSTTFTLVNQDGTPLTTTAGTPSGLTYTKFDSAAVPAAIGTNDIVVGSITSDRIRTGAITADIIAVPVSGGLNPSINVGTTGIGIGNPIGLIENNASATTISPGKILIAGSTTLANWKNGPDSTQIAGGAIAANTISANKLTIGSRGVDITGLQFQANWNGTAIASNVIHWTTGTIIYTDDGGTITTASISSNSQTWTSGVLYLYWIKGESIVRTTTATGTAYGTNNIVLATYGGGTNLVVNYGRTIIDGSQITTGTVIADNIRNNTTFTNNLIIGNNNFTINGSAQGSGLGTLTVSNGTINLLRIGYLTPSTVGFELKNASNEVLISSSTSSSAILNSAVTLSSLGYTGATDANKTFLDSSGNIQGVSSGAGISVANNQDSIIRAPGGGLLIGTSNGTGRLKIRLPQFFTNTMMKFTVDIFEYEAGYSCTMEIAGYNYSLDNTWYNVTARVVGDSNVEYPVYFGHDGTKACIWIGESSTTWSLPQVRVKEFLAGYSNVSRAQWESGWELSFTPVSLSPGSGANQHSNAVLDTLPGANWQKISGSGKPADNATVGAVIGTNLTGTFSEAEFNTRFTTGTINGTYIKNASIDSAQIKDLAVSAAKIQDLAVTNAKIGNLEVDTIKIANNAVSEPVVAFVSSSRTLGSTYSTRDLDITVPEASAGRAQLFMGAIRGSDDNYEGSSMTLNIRVDKTNVAGTVVGSIILNDLSIGSFSDENTTSSFSAAFVFTDTPSAEYRRYHIYIRQTDSSASTLLTPTFIMSEVLKK